jgi:hypothetical protein
MTSKVPPTACYHAFVRWAALLLIPAVALAAPQVEIKAQSQVSLSRVRLRDSGLVEVSGRLVDKLTGDGLGGERVDVVLGGERKWATTAPDGSFLIELPGTSGIQDVEVQFRGGRAIDPAKLEMSTDPAKAQVELELKKVGDDPKGAKLVVGAVADGVAAAVPVSLEVTPAAHDDWKSLAGAATSGQPFTLLRKDAGGPGMYRVRATFAGDDVRQKATIEGALELVAATTTTMDVASTKLAYEDELSASGKVVDDDGHPIARAAVTLAAGDRRLAQGATGDDGTYHFKVEAELLGECPARPCQFGVQAQADPGLPYLRASRSEPAVIRVAAPQPVPVSYTVAAFVATALAAGGFFAARSKPWRRLRRPAPPAEVPSQEGEIQQEVGGLVAAKAGVMSTLRGRTDDSFSGVVRDTVRGRPVADAVVRLILGDSEREMRTGVDGSFAFERLAAAEWRAEVAAAGHVTEKFGVTIPHRGELRGVRVDLVPVRERVFQLYRRAAEPILPESRLWGVWSPRQIVDHIRGKRPTPALAELTDFVEEIYFSPRLAAETLLPEANDRVDRAIRERARV